MKRLYRHRVELVRDSYIGPIDSAPIRSPEQTAEILRRSIGYPDREEFHVLFLDAAHRPMGTERISVGSLSAAIVHPREVFTGAILRKARAIVCAHNHPSGNTDPSLEDTEVTNRLIQAGKILGIPVLDSIILGNDGTYHAMRGNSPLAWQ